MGLLPDVARDLAVSIPAAGMPVSAYALGVTIGAPIVAIAVAKMPRKKALMSLIGVFIVGNLLCAMAPNYGVLMLARIVTAFCHGAFFGIGSVVAAGLVAPNRRAQAIALSTRVLRSPMCSACRSAPRSVRPSAGEQRSGQ